MPKREIYFTEVKGALYVRIPYQDATGKWKSKYKRVTSKAEGRKIAAELKTKLQQNGHAPVTAEKMTFAQLVERYPRPMPAWYKQLFLDSFGPRKLQSIDYAALLKFREQRAQVKHKATKEPRTVATLNREMETLRRLFVFAHKQGWIQRNPFNVGEGLITKAQEHHRDRIPTDDEINRLLEHAVEPRAHLRPLIIAALDTGLRKGKLLTLTKAQINLETNLLDLGRPKVKNKKHPRFVGITKRLRRELEDWLTAHPELKDDEPIFGITDDCKRSWRTLCKLAKVTGLHFHDLRHWYATNAIMAGLPKDLVMKQTGHTESATFDRYFNVDEEIARRVALALDEQATHK